MHGPAYRLPNRISARISPGQGSAETLEVTFSSWIMSARGTLPQRRSGAREGDGRPMSRVREDFEPGNFAQAASRSWRTPGRNAVAIRRKLAGGGRSPSSRRSLYLDIPSRQSGRDVICAGMYRACSTWQYEVVGHLVENHLKGLRLGYVCGESYESLGQHQAGRTPRGESAPWRVLKSHEGGRSFARALESGQALSVYVYRDLRDV